MLIRSFYCFVSHSRVQRYSRDDTVGPWCRFPMDAINLVTWITVHQNLSLGITMVVTGWRNTLASAMDKHSTTLVS